MPAVHRRAPSRDAELGKRDDDFRPRSRESPGTVGISWRWRKRRAIYVVLGLVLVYLFISNMPTDLAPIDERVGQAMRPGHTLHNFQETKEPRGAPPRSREDAEDKQYYHNGPIKFYRLATTLRAATRTGGTTSSNKNVLFAASSLKSVANLIPMACQMATVDKNYVHFALTGRDPLPLDDVLQINGVDKESCAVYFHDARGDYSEYSSETRAEVSVSGAMKHINDFIHPQAIVMDDSTLEDLFFIRAMRKRAAEYGRALVEIPAGRYEDFLWIARLDSGSLASWFFPTLDILIHAPSGSSGGLIRLIKSLQKADYTGLRAPRLSIELPNDIEPFARNYIEGLVWPPDKKASPLKTNAFSLRHRIQTSKLTSEQASLRFVESFFPASTYNDHVLVLSPQAEVHPLYLQYLHYLTLEYRYSSDSVAESDDLIGLSLDVPTTFLNGSSGFEAPRIGDMEPLADSKPDKYDPQEPVPFLYQAPSSTASLIFGDKWVTFHNFLSRRLQLAESGKSEKHTKQVSEAEPAWMEYLLELITARSWNMLHPAYPMTTVHNELAQIPEEYLREMEDKSSTDTSSQPKPLSDNEPFLMADVPPTHQMHPENTPDQSDQPLLNLLPFNGKTPELSGLPHLYRNGKLFTVEGNKDFQDLYQSWFREHIGGCDAETAAKKRNVHYLSADDLFCVPGIPPDFDEGVDEVQGAVESSESTEDESEAEATEEAKGRTAPSRDVSGAGEVDDNGQSVDEAQQGNQV